MNLQYLIGLTVGGSRVFSFDSLVGFSQISGISSALGVEQSKISPNYLRFSLFCLKLSCHLWREPY